MYIQSNSFIYSYATCYTGLYKFVCNATLLYSALHIYIQIYISHTAPRVYIKNNSLHTAHKFTYKATICIQPTGLHTKQQFVYSPQVYIQSNSLYTAHRFYRLYMLETALPLYIQLCDLHRLKHNMFARKLFFVSFQPERKHRRYK
jgi:hypothetical protein